MSNHSAIGEEFKKELERKGLEHTHGVMIKPKPLQGLEFNLNKHGFPSRNEGESQLDYNKRLDEFNLKLIKPVTEYLDAQSIKYNALRGIGLVSAIMRVEDIFRLGEQHYVEYIIDGETKVFLIR